MATIALEGIRLFGYHGVHRAERSAGGWFGYDIYVETDIDAAAHSDDVIQTIDYTRLFALAEREHDQARNLIETLAVAIRDAIAAEFTQLTQVRVRVSKFSPPIEGAQVARTFVEVC